MTLSGYYVRFVLQNAAPSYLIFHHQAIWQIFRPISFALLTSAFLASFGPGYRSIVGDRNSLQRKKFKGFEDASWRTQIQQQEADLTARAKGLVA
jgi:hypothetical protein